MSLAEDFRRVAFHAPDGNRYFTDEDGETLFIGFPGAVDSASVLCFLTFASAPYGETGMAYRVHEGVLAIWLEILPALKELLAGFADREVRIVGYSFGGALTYLCHDLAVSMGLRVSTTVFESPRVFGRIPRKAKARFSGITFVKSRFSPITMLMPGFRRPKPDRTIRLKPKVRRISILNHMEGTLAEALESVPPHII